MLERGGELDSRTVGNKMNEKENGWQGNEEKPAQEEREKLNNQPSGSERNSGE